MIKNTKAQGISMNVVILAAIAVMVLLLVGTFMSGGFKSLTGKITQFVAGSSQNATSSGQQAGCNNACSSWCSAGAKTSGVEKDQVQNACSAQITADTVDTDTDDQDERERVCGCTSWLG